MVGHTDRVGGGVLQYWDMQGVGELTCDVAIVGSGAGGATVAAELAQAGLDVVVLEEGGYFDTRSFTSEATPAVKRLYRSAGAERMSGPPSILFMQGSCVGGSTVINGGMSWRTPNRVLEGWSRERGLPSVHPEALAPVFDHLEKQLYVGPQEPGSIGLDDGLFRLGAERLGYGVVADRRNQNHCVGSNNCGFGCPTGAKQSMLVTMLPRAVGHGARIVSDCRITRILTRPRSGGMKQAVGVEGRLIDPSTGKAGPALRVLAPRVVLACGATETPALLQRNGLCGGSGQLGRNLTVHPNTKCVGIFDDEVQGWKGVHQGHQVHEFIDEGLLMTVAFVPPQVLAMTFPMWGNALFDVVSQINHLVTAGVLVEDTGSGVVRPGPFGSTRVSYRLTDYDMQQLMRGVGLVSEILFASGARRVVSPVAGMPVLESPDDIARLFKRPVNRHDLEVLTVHIMGSARMGVDPRVSVVGPFGEAFDVGGLFVADASVLPSPIGVNPMLTIMALATRTALHMLGLC